MVIPLAVLYTALLLTTVSNMLYLRKRRNHRRVPACLPSVSIVVPARNEAHNLPQLLPSLLEQKYENLEIIIYDDASEDGTGTVVRQFGDPRLRYMIGDGPPTGWVGKVHALYQATREANGEVFLFLDADVTLKDPEALTRLVTQYLALPHNSVLSGLMRLRGGGELLVSLVPYTLMTLFPLPVAARIPHRSTGVLGGACWLISRDNYFAHEPHENHPDEILDDLVIGRYLKGKGVVPFLNDLQPDVEVRMYRSLGEAWAGFRKNSSLLGGGPIGLAASVTLFACIFVIFPVLWWPGIIAVYLSKLASDRFTGFSILTSVLAPVSFVLAILVTLDSARGHVTGNVRWKGRQVARR